MRTNAEGRPRLLWQVGCINLIFVGHRSGKHKAPPSTWSGRIDEEMKRARASFHGACNHIDRNLHLSTTFSHAHTHLHNPASTSVSLTYQAHTWTSQGPAFQDPCGADRMTRSINSEAPLPSSKRSLLACQCSGQIHEAKEDFAGSWLAGG